MSNITPDSMGVTQEDFDIAMNAAREAMATSVRVGNSHHTDILGVGAGTFRRTLRELKESRMPADPLRLHFDAMLPDIRAEEAARWASYKVPA